MSRFVQLSYVIGTQNTDPLLQSFLQKVGGSNLSNTEKSATDIFLKSLRDKTTLFAKLVWIHPFVGSTDLSRSLNLLNTDKYAITYSGNVQHLATHTVFNAGKGTIDISAGLQANTDMFFGLYARNSSQFASFDIGQSSLPASRQAFCAGQTTNGYRFDCGNASGASLYLTASSYDKLAIGNSYNTMLSLWRDGTKLTSKTSNVAYAIPNLIYNPEGTSNTRQFACSIMGKGLTDTETIDLTTIVNAYMAALGRAV